jgi:hypothetical protein
MNMLETIWNHTLQNSQKLGFEFLTAVVMQSSVFRYITLCSCLKVSRRFGGTCRLHLQGGRISQERKQYEAGSKQLACYLLHADFLQHVPLKHQPTFNGLHGVIFQEIELFRN